MKITLKKVTVKEVCEGYVDNDEEGVFGYGGRLDIRPKYQREFIYKDKERNAVINTIINSFPLNVMYWVKKSDGNFEVLDGQQRTISFCQYVKGDFSVDNGKYFPNLQPDIQEKILKYPLLVYVCEGEPSEKLEWFRTINIAGEKLTDQELRNATYAGSWTTSAKSYFSKSNCVAKAMAGDYLNGRPIRQEYLETVLKWICDRENISTIEEYMGKHQFDENADELWKYFRNVFDWVNKIFPKKRKKIMKGLPWGIYYNQNKNRSDLNPDVLEERIQELLKDPEVTKNNGIYAYLLDGKEKHLSLRTFDDVIKNAVYEKQNHKCAICGKEFPIEKMQADHIVPWSKGGKTIIDNCQMLCVEDNLKKSNY